ncbi:hypothetical protein E4U31_007204 [Claviceps sp. LM219 group G6]|nr:hypothetical protein E4U31_007204 [Claviceps sp. LM219 group G6]
MYRVGIMSQSERAERQTSEPCPVFERIERSKRTERAFSEPCPVSERTKRKAPEACPVSELQACPAFKRTKRQTPEPCPVFERIERSKRTEEQALEACPDFNPPQKLVPERRPVHTCARKPSFIDEKSMSESAAACAWRDFQKPRLGRFTHQRSIRFTKLLGWGEDGIVWRVRIDSKTYALKIFWDIEPRILNYFAFERECQNASLLAKMRFAIENSGDSIWLHPNPKTHREGVYNLHAFSDEGRSRQRYRDMPDAVKYSAPPRLRECYGWTLISGEEIWSMPKPLRPPIIRLGQHGRDYRLFFRPQQYYAIVYEYIPHSEAGLNVDVVQPQLDFFQLGGWCLAPIKRNNWGGDGILLDMSDTISPFQIQWHRWLYSRRRATDVTEQTIYN